MKTIKKSLLLFDKNILLAKVDYMLLQTYLMGSYCITTWSFWNVDEPSSSLFTVNKYAVNESVIVKYIYISSFHVYFFEKYICS